MSKTKASKAADPATPEQLTAAERLERLGFERPPGCPGCGHHDTKIINTRQGVHFCECRNPSCQWGTFERPAVTSKQV